MGEEAPAVSVSAKRAEAERKGEGEGGMRMVAVACLPSALSMLILPIASCSTRHAVKERMFPDVNVGTSPGVMGCRTEKKVSKIRKERGGGRGREREERRGRERDLPWRARDQPQNQARWDSRHSSRRRGARDRWPQRRPQSFVREKREKSVG